MPLLPRVTGASSMRRIVMLAIAAGVALPALLVGPFIAAESFRNDAQARIHAVLQQYGSTLGSALAQPIWLADPQAAAPLVDAVMVNPDVVAIEVDDAALGSFIARKKPVAEDEPLVQQRFAVNKDGTAIGSLMITMTERHMRRQLLVQAGKLAGAIGLQIALALVFLYLVFEHRLIRPVQELVQALRRMASGDLSTPIAMAGKNDELDRLALGLDELRTQLAKTLGEVQTLNTELESRVAQRTHDLQTALADLKNAQGEIERAERMAALGAMVAGISHELNTPIGNSLTVASTLVDLSQDFQQRMDQGLTRAALREYTQATADASALVQRNLERAAQLILSFKQVAVDRTVAQRRSFALDAVLQEIMTTLVAVLKRKGYTIETACAPDLVMDSYPGQLGQVVTNIVHNADLHGLEGRADGSIRVSGRAIGPGQVEICIEDNGKGIAPEHIGRVFEPFFTTRMGRGGSGLGLNIVHNLVRDVLGGDIRVDSTPGKGTRFTLVIPRTAPAAREA